jgi:hypothetical protein
MVPSVTMNERVIPAAEIREDYMRWLKAVGAAEPVSRDDEIASIKSGLAAVEQSLEVAE